MYPRIHNISFDCHDTYALAGFAGRTREQEVERALGLGAVLVSDRRHADSSGWVVLADPEGNEFCVLRGAAERAGTTIEEEHP
ncbi:VOC family protein [Micromonospora peucetia]